MLIDVIEYAAQKIEEYIGANKLEIMIFGHKVNNVAKAMLGEREGVDTANSDWFEVLPLIIDTINK